MRTLLATLFILLSFSAFGQFRLASNGNAVQVSSANDSTYTVDVTFRSDLTNSGYQPNGIQIGDRLFTQREQVYRIASIPSSDFTTAQLVLVEQDINGVDTEGYPIGQVMVYRPSASGKIPQIAFPDASGALQAAVDSYNSRVAGSSGGGGGTTVVAGKGLTFAGDVLNAQVDSNDVKSRIGDSMVVAKDYADANDDQYAFIPESKIQNLREIKEQIDAGAPTIWFLGDSKMESRGNFFGFVAPTFSRLGYPVLEGNQSSSNTTMFPAIYGITTSTTGTWTNEVANEGLINRNILGNSGATVTYTLSELIGVDTFFIAATGGLSVELFNGGSSLGTSNFSGGPTMHEVLVPSSATAIEVTATTSLSVHAIVFASADNDRLRVMNLGRSGSGADTWANVIQDATWRALYEPMLPELVVLDVGTNDAARTDIATYQANVATIIDYFLSNGVEVLAIAPPPRGGSVVSDTREMGPVLFDLSNRETLGTGFLSYYARYGSLDKMRSIGATGDDIHFLPEFGGKNVEWIINSIARDASIVEVDYDQANQVNDVTNDGDWDTQTDVGLPDQIILNTRPNGPYRDGSAQHVYPLVIKRNGDNLIQLGYPTDAQKGAMAYRTKTQGVWSRWKYVQNGEAYDTSTEDWNKIFGPGINYSSVSGTAANGPGIAVNYIVENSFRITSVGDTIIHQKAFPEDMALSDEYYRTYRGAATGWSEWFRVETGRVFGNPGSVDWNTITKPGLYEDIVLGTSPNGPGGVQHFINNISRNGRIFQMAMPYGNHSTFKVRTFDGTTWTAWRDLEGSGGGGSDDLGDHTATQTINTDNNWISGDGDGEGISIADDGDVGIATQNPIGDFFVKARESNFGISVTESNAARALNVVDPSAVVRILRIGADISTGAPAIELMHRTTNDGANTAYWDVYPDANGLNFRDRRSGFFTPLTLENQAPTGSLVVKGSGDTEFGGEALGQDATQANGLTTLSQVQALVDGATGETAIVADYTELGSFSGTEDIVIVSDALTGGTFIRDASATTVDGGIVPVSGWRRQFNGATNAKWFGVNGDGITDNTQAFANAISYIDGKGGGRLYIPEGVYALDSLVFDGVDHIHFEGAGVEEVQFITRKPVNSFISINSGVGDNGSDTDECSFSGFRVQVLHKVNYGIYENKNRRADFEDIKITAGNDGQVLLPVAWFSNYSWLNTYKSISISHDSIGWHIGESTPINSFTIINATVVGTEDAVSSANFYLDEGINALSITGGSSEFFDDNGTGTHLLVNRNGVINIDNVDFERGAELLNNESASSFHNIKFTNNYVHNVDAYFEGGRVQFLEFVNNFVQNDVPAAETLTINAEYGICDGIVIGTGQTLNIVPGGSYKGSISTNTAASLGKPLTVATSLKVEGEAIPGVLIEETGTTPFGPYLRLKNNSTEWAANAGYQGSASDRFVFRNNNTGNVALELAPDGTTNPKQDLLVDGNARVDGGSLVIESADANSALEVRAGDFASLDFYGDGDETGNRDASIRFWYPDGAGGWTQHLRIGSDQNVGQDFVITPGNGLSAANSLLYVRKSNGNVGIGGVYPQAKLEVDGNVLFRDVLDMDNNQIEDVADADTDDKVPNWGQVQALVAAGGGGGASPVNRVYQQETYAGSVTIAHDTLAPNTYITLGGDITLDVSGITSGSGQVNLVLTADNQTPTLASGLLVGNHAYPDKSGDVIRLEYRVESDGLVWYNRSDPGFTDAQGNLITEELRIFDQGDDTEVGRIYVDSDPDIPANRTMFFEPDGIAFPRLHFGTVTNPLSSIDLRNVSVLDRVNRMVAGPISGRINIGSNQAGIASIYNASGGLTLLSVGNITRFRGTDVRIEEELDMDNGRIYNVATATSANDAVNLQQLIDSLATAGGSNEVERVIAGQFQATGGAIKGWGAGGTVDETAFQSLGLVGDANINSIAGGFVFPYDVTIKSVTLKHRNNSNGVGEWGWLFYSFEQTDDSSTITTEFLRDESTARAGVPGPALRDYNDNDWHTTTLTAADFKTYTIPAGHVVGLAVSYPTSADSDGTVDVKAGVIVFEKAN